MVSISHNIDNFTGKQKDGWFVHHAKLELDCFFIHEETYNYTEELWQHGSYTVTWNG